MPSDNPFGEPSDSDRTLFIPLPGGKRAPSANPAPAPRARAADTAVPQGPESISTGANPLLAAAASLLALLARLRNTARPPDAGDLRERAVTELRRFEQTARDGGIGMEQLRPAHFALCASLDDVVMATPWGAEGAWASASLASTFHQQVRAGEVFFSVLKQVMLSPAANLSVIELMYFCLSLGFQGQYRRSQRGLADLERVREEVYALIVRQRAPIEPGLSPQWRGVDAPYRPRGAEIPLWVAAVAGAALIAALFAYVTIDVNTAADTVLDRIDAVPPATMPDIARAAAVEPPPAPVDPGALERLREFLAPEVAANLVQVTNTESVPIIIISGAGMFASGSAAVEPGRHGLLARIGEALKTEPGPVTIAGYTDNQPIRSLKYPSNTELSAARAQAAADLIGEHIGDPARLTPSGLGAANPVASNVSPAGREKNRRIEVILHRAS